MEHIWNIYGIYMEYIWNITDRVSIGWWNQQTDVSAKKTRINLSSSAG